MRNCVAVFLNYGSQCDRSYAVTASQFDRNETHGLTALSCIQAFLGEKLYDRSIFDIRHSTEMKTKSSKNVFFSYEGKELLKRKLVYLNKNAPAIE